MQFRQHSTLGTMLLALLLAPVSTAAAADLPIEGIAWVGFRVSDIDDARAHYTNVLGYEEAFHYEEADGTPVHLFKVNDEQFIELYPNLKEGEIERLRRIAIQTSDINRLHRMLSERGLNPPPVRTSIAGNRVFSLKDPGGHTILFVQYMPDSLHSKSRGQFLGPNRVSDHLIHTGVHVPSEAVADPFWRDALGFVEIWRGGSQPGQTNWVNLRMPGARGDYIEYMLYSDSEPPNRGRLGSMHHICLNVDDIQRAHRAMLERGVPDTDRHQPRIGRIRKWLLNIFDPDGSRAEYMEPNTVD